MSSGLTDLSCGEMTWVARSRVGSAQGRYGILRLVCWRALVRMTRRCHAEAPSAGSALRIPARAAPRPSSWAIAGHSSGRSRGFARHCAPIFFFVAGPSGVPMVGSCRAEVTDSPAGRCGNGRSARRIARTGRAAFNGKARCGSGRGVSASRGEGPGTGERRVSRQPLIPCVGLRRARFPCLARVACLVGPCSAADERSACCRIPASPVGQPGPGRQCGLGRVAFRRAAVGQPGEQFSGSGERQPGREQWRGLRVRHCRAV